MEKIAANLRQPLGYFSGAPAPEFGDSSARFFRGVRPKDQASEHSLRSARGLASPHRKVPG